ncbi:MAG: hypothetical protein O7D34_12145 [Ignavibacteria bacterium]|nr:hypothetical protein [Ignavibacteria bacterium]
MSTGILGSAFALWFAVFFFVAESNAAENPKIDTYLETILNSANDHELVSVYVVLEDRLSLTELQNLTWDLKRKERQCAY